MQLFGCTEQRLNHLRDALPIHRVRFRSAILPFRSTWKPWRRPFDGEWRALSTGAGGVHWRPARAEKGVNAKGKEKGVYRRYTEGQGERGEVQGQGGKDQGPRGGARGREQGARGREEGASYKGQRSMGLGPGLGARGTGQAARGKGRRSRDEGEGQGARCKGQSERGKQQSEKWTKHGARAKG